MLKKIKFKPTIIFLDPPFIAIKYYNEALEYFENEKYDKAESIFKEIIIKLNRSVTPRSGSWASCSPT